MTTAIYMVVISLITLLFFTTAMSAMDREAAAREDYYCKHYGAEINQHHGEDVCQ